MIPTTLTRRYGQQTGQNEGRSEQASEVNKDSQFEVKTPSSVAAVRGTGFITDVHPDGSSAVQTTHGIVQVAAQGQSVSVGAGQATTVATNAAPATPITAPPPPNKLCFGFTISFTSPAATSGAHAVRATTGATVAFAPFTFTP